MGDNPTLEIMNQMFMDEKLMDSQKHGIIVCLKKIPRPTRPEDHRPLTLLNADFKLLARIIANRIRPWINNLSILVNIVESKTITYQGPSPPSGTPLLRLN